MPLRDLAAADDRVALARDPAARRSRTPTSRSRGPASRTARTASAPMKPVSSRQHQPSPASIGPRSTHQVVAVQVEAHLQAQRVARAEARRHARRGDELVPQRGRVAGRAQQLDAVLAGVAGAAHQHLGPGQPPRSAGHARGQRRARRAPARSRARAGPARRASRSRRSRSRTLAPRAARAACRNHVESRSWLAAFVTVR